MLALPRRSVDRAAQGVRAVGLQPFAWCGQWQVSIIVVKKKVSVANNNRFEVGPYECS
jgi:hypothetical protein